MAQMKEPIKTPEKELSNKEIDNLSDAEFKTLVIRMLTESTELGCKMKENFPNLAKETESPGSPGSSKKRVPKKLEPRKHTVRHIIITLPKVKGKERILKEARETETVIPTKEFP